MAVPKTPLQQKKELEQAKAAGTITPRQQQRLQYLSKGNSAANGGKQPGANVNGANKAVKQMGKINDATTKLGLEALGNYTPEPLDFSGAPEVVGSGDLEADRQKYIDSYYGLATQNFDRDQAREMEAQKQELANRGIVYDPGNASSAYGKAVGAIDEKWAAARDQAKQSAIVNSGAEMERQADIQGKARDRFITELLTKRGLPLEEAQKILAMGKTSEAAGASLTYEQIQKEYEARMAALRRSGGSSNNNGSDGPTIMGGYPSGFGV